MDNKHFSVNILHEPNKPDGKSWHFLDIGIINVFQTSAEVKTDKEPFDILSTIQNLFDSELQKKDGMFSSYVLPQQEDEDLDVLLCIDTYNIRCSYQPFLDDLRNYGITDLFGADLTKWLFIVLRDIGQFIKDNTDKPQAIKNHIISKLEVWGSTPLLSAMMKISVMRGIEMFLQECLDTIEKYEYGTAEVQSLFDWVILEEGKLVCEFTVMPFTMGAKTQELKEYVKPFTDYLYNTEVGRIANDTTLSCIYGTADMSEPQYEKPKPTRGRGRPKETLKDKMIDDADGKKLQKIHTKISGKKGKDATLIVLACIKKGWMAKPTYTQVKNEFGEDIGSKTGFNKYLKEAMFTKEEIEGAMAGLD